MLEDEDKLALADFTKDLVELIRLEIRKKGFWRDDHSINELRTEIQRELVFSQFFDDEDTSMLAWEMIDLARSRHHYLVD
jgi:hypothetical protein